MNLKMHAVRVTASFCILLGAGCGTGVVSEDASESQSELMTGGSDPAVEAFVGDVDDTVDDLGTASTGDVPGAVPPTEAEADIADADIRPRCGTENTSPETESAELSPLDPFSASEDAPRGEGDATGYVAAAKAKTISVYVYFHVIRTGTKASQGNVSKANLQKQLKVMNKSYGGDTGGATTRFQFVLKGIDRTTSKSWFKAAAFSGTEDTMKRKLHRGGKGSLNIYLKGLERYSETLGWSNFPWEKAGKSDGVIIESQTIPGGSLKSYNQGDTAVHEAGHWLGLLHTFDPGTDGDGCSYGDGVSDTPAEKTASFKCDTHRNTCPAKYYDPVRNFMDYSPDSCMFMFTAGQGKRALAEWRKYRD